MQNANLRTEKQKLRRQQTFILKNLHKSQQSRDKLTDELQNLLKAQEIILEQNESLAEKQIALEQQQAYLEQARLKFRKRTIELFGKMIDLKKAKKTIKQQNELLEKQKADLTREKEKAGKFYHRFRERTIELFGKMIDLKKAKKTITSQNKELAKVNATKDKFFSIIAHDLRNPIGGFLNLTNLLVEEYETLEEEEKRQFITSLNQSAKQLQQLMENLLHWSRAQTGTISYNPEFYSLKTLINEQLEVLRTNLQEKSLLVYLASSDDHIVYTDLPMMSTVIRNLLSNAIKFSHPGMSIHIRTQKNRDKTILTIQDEGIGMTKEKQEHLFALGSSQTQTGTCNEKGSGLGLLLSNEFVRQCGGALAVESAPKKGTTFTISLPATNNNTP
jgi:signal transduction histidine kinase